MHRSTERILTTHVGSLARPSRLVMLMRESTTGPAYKDELRSAVQAAVKSAVAEQLRTGLDIVNDGEQSKPSFQSYFLGRLAGFERRHGLTQQAQRANSREYRAFKEYYDWASQRESPRELGAGVCTGPIAYKGLPELSSDLETLRSALEGREYADAFVPCIAPSYIAAVTPDEYYGSQEDYEKAIADAMAVEYKTITSAGFLVQLDDPRLISYYTTHPEASVEDCRKWAAHCVELINYSLRDIPQEMVRFHTCYSINIGPRVHELDLREVMDLLLKMNVAAYSFEAANPRHEHEYHLFEDIKLPDGKTVIPGVISHTTNLVEHPELIADRIMRFAKLVGKENVIAGADCGFSTSASAEWEIHPSIVWQKFSALASGAEIASKRLWQ